MQRGRGMIHKALGAPLAEVSGALGLILDDGVEAP